MLLGTHKVLTIIEYRAVSGVFRTIDPPPPFHPASVSSPRTKGGGYTLAVGGWGVNISEDSRHWIGLLQYNLGCAIFAYIFFRFKAKQIPYFSRSFALSEMPPQAFVWFQTISDTRTEGKGSTVSFMSYLFFLFQEWLVYSM